MQKEESTQWPAEKSTLWPAEKATTANATSSPTVNPYVERLKLATLLYGISLFMSWGVLYWGFWYEGIYWDPYFFEVRLMTGFGEMLSWLDYMFVQVWMFDHYLWMFEQSGPFPTLFILLRDLMPFAFIVAFTVAWRKKETLPIELEKIGAFTAGYAGLMGVIMLYIIVQFSSDPYVGGSRIAFEMFGGSIGFWLAVFAGIFLHPKLIPHPEQFMLGKKSSSLLDDEDLNDAVDDETASTSGEAPEFWVMVLYYLPFLYLYSVVISVSRGGDDDALFLGTVIPITGFLIGLFRYRMEFFEGFVVNIGFCVPFAFFFALAGYIGVFGDVDNVADILLFITLPALYLPYKNHNTKRHRRALGSAYAAPLCVMGMLFGLMLGVITRYGLF